MMKILVDADACPVKEIIEKVAKQKNIEVVMYIDSSHILSSDYSKIVTISKGRDAVDLALINDSEKGDVIATLDTSDLEKQIESAEESYGDTLKSAQTSYDRATADLETSTVQHENSLIGPAGQDRPG